MRDLSVGFLPLTNHLLRRVRQLSLPQLQDLQPNEIFQQDKSNTWIGRGGPKNCPTRSLDLTLRAFFVWRFIKYQVYKKKSAMFNRYCKIEN